MGYYVAFEAPAWVLCAAVLGLWCSGGIVGALLCWALGLGFGWARARKVAPVRIEYRDDPEPIGERPTLACPRDA